jgi:hypothetical protein
VTNTSLADAIRANAQRIGANPLDLATAMSYETGGTFNPAIRGGAGNRHVGLIQFGVPEQQRYGVTQATPAAQQVAAAADFLRDRGFRPGMGLADLYSTINAGSPGRYRASDAGNGGMPGTVIDKVTQQMGAHRAKAEALLGGSFTPTGPSPAAGEGQAPQAGTSLADALPGATLPTLAPVLPMPAGPDPLTPDPRAEALVRQQQRQADDQRRQALLSVNAFGR